MKQTVSAWSLSSWLVATALAMPVVALAWFAWVPESHSWLHLKETVLADYISHSLWLSVGVALGTFLIGVSTAWLTTMYRFPFSRFFQWALLLPMAMPAYIIAFTYTGMLDPAGPLQFHLRELMGWEYGSYWFPSVTHVGGAITMLSLVLYPYVYLLSRASFLEQSLCVLDVGRTLGLGPFQRFFRIALPLARPGIVAGVSIAVMETLADYGTVKYFGISTFTTGIFRTWFGLDDPAGAARLSGLLLGFVFIALTIERYSRSRQRFHHTSQRHQALTAKPLRGLPATLAAIACALPLLLGFIIPISQLGLWAADSWHSIDAHFLTLSWNSLWVAATAAVVATTLAAILVYGLRLHPQWPQRLAVRSAGLGYAIPGTVIAVGVMIPAGQFDHWLNQHWPTAIGAAPGLVLSGTFIALIFAYCLRFMAVSLQALESGMGRIKPNIDEAANSLGARRWRILQALHLPMLRGSLLTALLLVFVDVLKELPATLVMRPFDFNTLAVRAFELASDERLAEAALPSVAIVLTGLLPVLLLSRSIARSRHGADGKPLHTTQNATPIPTELDRL